MNQNESIMPWKDDPGARQVTITSTTPNCRQADVFVNVSEIERDESTLPTLGA